MSALRGRSRERIRFKAEPEAVEGESLKLAPKQLEILQHALGLDQYGRGSMYRNRFCAGGDDEPVCRELVALGLMKEHARTEWLPYFNCSVSDAGIQAVRECSPEPPKLTRSQLRYRRFLNSGAGFAGMSFKEWLTAPDRQRGK